MKKTLKFLPILTLFVAFLTTLAIFFPALTNADGETVISGLKATFGGELSSFVIGSTPIVNATARFSFTNFVAFFLPLLVASAIIIIRHGLKMKGLVSALLKVGLFAAFLLGLIFFTIVAKNTTYVVNVLGNEIDGDFANAALGSGPVIGIILSSLGLLTAGLEMAIPFVKNK